VSSETGRVPDDQTLVRYLIGGMTNEEAEPLDELSVADAGFEARLQAVEYDLVDAYVNGELAGDTLARFTSHYLSSPDGLAKVEIAQALRGYRRVRAADRQASLPVARRMGWWPLAAAAVFLLVAGWLAIDNVRLRQQETDARQREIALEQREQQLQEAVNRQHSEITATAEALARAREALAAGQPSAPTPPSSGPRVLAFVLLPGNRGAEDVPLLKVPADADCVTLRLQLDSDDYGHYIVEITDVDTSRIVWRSGRVPAVTAGTRKLVPVSVPATTVRPGAYVAAVTGAPDRGPTERVESYPFRIVLQ
jgi:hypothetical protein